MVENEKKRVNSNTKPDDASEKSPKIGKKIKSPFGSKIIIDTVGARSGSCIFHNFLYALLFLFGGLYFAYLCDKTTFQQYSDNYPYLGYLEKAFVLIEDYSPFHQFTQSDEEFVESLKRTVPEIKDDISDSSLKIFSKSELSLYSGEEGSLGLYLGFLGKVYDVSKGKDYYGPGGGYAFFSAKDGSRAFVTGQFDEAGLIDDVSGLPHSDYLGLAEWQEFYEKDYTLVGVVQGRFYDEKGEVTEEWKQVQESIASAEKDKDAKDVEKKIFPPCNMEWNAEKGTRFWCTKKSGGVQRNWVGVPRSLFYPGRDERCSCIRTTGPPSIDQASKENRGDLDNAHLKQYEGCAENSFECWKST